MQSKLLRSTDAFRNHIILTCLITHSGYAEFHLAEGKMDVLVIYSERPEASTIRFIRMGSHDELFDGPLL